jgi:hypothetical protein
VTICREEDPFDAFRNGQGRAAAPSNQETEEHVSRMKKVFEAALPSFLPGASRAIPRGHAGGDRRPVPAKR